MADFVAELLLDEKLADLNPDGYISFGQKHEQQIWKEFEQEMKHSESQGWLYGSREIDGKSKNDLGYFVGYMICENYYEKAKNKKQALGYMIGLNLTDKKSKEFLTASGCSPAANKKVDAK